MRRPLTLLALSIALGAGCSGGGDSPSPNEAPPDAPRAVAGAQVKMRFSAREGFFASPFPSDDRKTAAGLVDVSGFPNPDGVQLPSRVLAILAGEARGFGLTSGVFFSLTAPIDPSRLPDLEASTQPGATVFLVGIDKAQPDYGKRYPLLASFRDDGGPFGDKNLLALLPLQGVPLRPGASYAAVVLRELGDAAGQPLGVSEEMAAISAGKRPGSMPESAWPTYEKALSALGEAGVEPSRIAGLAAFTTDDPSRAIYAVRDDMLAHDAPQPLSPFAPGEVFDGFCVYQTTIRMPVYQAGAPPFEKEGGGWAFDASGKPVKQGDEEANFVVTIPRRPMPPSGYPVVLMSRTGGGGERPLVDRGVRDAKGDVLVPGSGPAMTFAQAGFAGASVDGPHGGLRNVTHGDEQFLMFNVTNPVALRDNVRQSAAELALAAHVLATITVDASACPGSGEAAARFDAGTMALMGHSMGATIAPLSLAIEPGFRAAVLSGAGGSWIENVVYKKKPLAVAPVAELLLGIATSGYHLHRHDPLLSLFQWAGEAADPPVYGAAIVREPPPGSPPRHVLMLQGIVDHYIMPSIANAASLSFGLDQAGDALDAQTPEIASFSPLSSLLGFAGRRSIGYPASGNAEGPGGAKVTAVNVQHREDGVEDGHEIAFQVGAAKRQYRCFLESFANGTPRVPAPADEGAACD